MENWEVRAERMVLSQIEVRGIRDGKVLEAFRNVPRHLFVPARHRKWAYQDSPLPLKKDRPSPSPTWWP